MRYGLIAGNGRFPLLALESARRLGHDVTVIAIQEEAAKEVESLAPRRRVAGVVEIHQRRVEVARVEGAEDRRRRRRGRDLEAFALEEEPEGFEDVLLVVGDEDAGTRHGVSNMGS